MNTAEDFSWLLDVCNNQTEKPIIVIESNENKGKAEILPIQEKSLKNENKQLTDEIGKLAIVKLNGQQEAYKKYKEVYAEYQENIRKAGMIRAEILKGAKAGEPAEVLLLKAVECIGYMTGDALYRQQFNGIYD